MVTVLTILTLMLPLLQKAQPVIDRADAGCGAAAAGRVSNRQFAKPVVRSSKTAPAVVGFSADQQRFWNRQNSGNY
jgi:hypothetical protein